MNTLDEQQPLIRGSRRTPRIDLNEVEWFRNEFDVGVLCLSSDPVSGAETFALDCPPATAVSCPVGRASSSRCWCSPGR